MNRAHFKNEVLYAQFTQVATDQGCQPHYLILNFSVS